MSDGRDQGRDSCGATADEEFGDFDKRGGDSTAKDERFDSGIASLPEEFPREPTMSDALRERGLDGDTILHQAIIMKVPDAVPLALIQLADDTSILNLQNDLLQTPLHLAVVTERPAVVQKLVESGSAPWIQDMQGNTPLHLACDLRTRACLHAIVHSVPPAALATALQVQNYPKGLTCLHVAIMKQDLSMVEDLLQLGVDIDAWEPCSGRAALHLAVETSSTAMVDCLLSHGACVNSRMWDGCTPLHLAVGRGHEPLVKLLCKHGADDSLENLEHDCPSDLPMCGKLLKTVLCLEDIS